MTDYFYKFTDQSESLSVMADFTYTDDEGVIHSSQGGHQYALWVVGEISGITGWHVNLRVIDESLDISALEAYSVQPVNPVCVWG